MAAPSSAPVALPVTRVLVVLDGLADRPHPETGNRSPVEAASTPNLDRLARTGRLGDAIVVGPGIAPESDAGVFALLGYDPSADSPGRGVLEALGVDLPLAPGDIALRLNFATTDGTGTIVDSRVGRSLGTAESRDLAASLTAADLLADLGVRAEVRATVGHRGVLWLHPVRDGPLSPAISNADPFYDKVGGMGQARRPDAPTIRPVLPLEPTPAALRSAEAVNRFLAAAAPILAGHRVNARRAMAGKKVANAILVRNAGALPTAPLRSFRSRYGVDGGAVTEMPVERGIARTLGLEDRYLGPMTGDRDLGYAERARAVREMAARLPFVYVHLKGPDEPGHDGDAPAKQAIVESIDRAFFGPFLDGLDLGRTRILVTADHATPCILKGHSDDPVPLLYNGSGVGADPSPPALKFGETAAAHGSLGHRRGTDALRLLFSEPFPAGPP
ncbi:MAG TPA: alkaline phosphatase family protein [Thermoplasmata archaeon]|nr:alkaline phosphatase family protein [Thermoplasmata archaeon]